MLAAPAAAEPGDLDPTFGSDGRVVALAGNGFVARAVAVQPDGRIVVGGYSCAPAEPQDGTCRQSGSSAFEMVRYLPDGTLDPEFGAGGVVTTALGIRRSQAFDVLVEPDGRIVLAGVARDGGGRDGFALARYDARGGLDPSFGEQGVSIVGVGSGFSGIADVAPAPGGGLYATGVASEGSATRFAIARYRADGALDGSFGRGGTTLGGPSARNQALATAVAPAGQVLAAGISAESDEPRAARFGLLRVDSGGALDAGFGAGGGLTVGLGSSASFANALLVLRDGRALAAGSATDAEGHQVMAFARVTADGRPDTTWDGDGSALLRVGDGALVADTVRDAADRLVAFGQSASGGADWRFAITRLSSDGLLDEGFGTGGVAVTAFPGTTMARATAGALTADGRLVAAGVACVGGRGAQCAGGSPRLALARYLGGGEPAREPRPAPSPAPPRPPPPVQKAPFAALSFPANRPSRRYRIRVRVACLRTRPCAGTLRARTQRPQRLGARRRGTRRRPRYVTLATRPVRVPAGASRDLTLKLTRTGRTLVRRLGRVRARISLRTPGSTEQVGRSATITRG